MTGHMVTAEQRVELLALIAEKMGPGDGGPCDYDTLWPSAVAEAVGITEAEIVAAMEGEEAKPCICHPHLIGAVPGCPRHNPLKRMTGGFKP